MLKLNIGAGRNQRPPEEGWVNIDIVPQEGIQKLIDLEIECLPYGDDSVDEVNMQDFLEHLSKMRQDSFLRDIFRVMKRGSKVFIQMPDIGVAAKRYCGALENPTELQHNIDGEGLAANLYGGQEYASNFHKWGYDQQSLTNKLEEIGFAIRDIHGDGGMNQLCLAAKPYNKVFLWLRGGIGDALQTCLANPSDRKPYEDMKVIEEFPTSDVDTSLWLRRLKNLKRLYPDIKVKIKAVSCNSRIAPLVTNNRFIDVIEEYKEVDEDTRARGYIDPEGYIHIEQSEYKYTRFAPEDETLFLSKEDTVAVNSIREKLNKYIVIHPFAGAKERVVFDNKKYTKLIDYIIDDLGYDVIVVGKSNENLKEDFRYNRKRLLNLVNKVSLSVSIKLTLDADAFIGTHSCMILAAWYSRIPSVCLVPPHHDRGQTWEKFFADELNPTVWGARQAFNRTMIIRNEKDATTESVISLLREVL